MKANDCDVVIVGAGAAGLAALQSLRARDLTVRCVEARDRLGGRIATVHDPAASVPIELGAEFVHGRPPEIWDLVGSQIADRNTHSVFIGNGPVHENESFGRVGQLLSDLQAEAAGIPDQSFASYLQRSNYPDEVKRWAAAYVEGFNAAPQDRISIRALAQESHAAREIGGDRLFSVRSGYDTVVRALAAPVELSKVVERIEWQPGSAAVSLRSATRVEIVRCAQVIITVPLGVLQAPAGTPGAIAFDPPPEPILRAARSLGFGPVLRVTFHFDTAFWQQNAKLADAGFFHTDEPAFPTWWKSVQPDAPVLTGWTAGPAADALAGQTESEIVAGAIDALERIVGTKAPSPRAAYFHDWQSDPFARGAYSYVPAGQLATRDLLAQPVCDTLYLAGEPTDITGHGATVHGAIISGRRAARQVIRRYEAGARRSG